MRKAQIFVNNILAYFIHLIKTAYTDTIGAVTFHNA